VHRVTDLAHHVLGLLVSQTALVYDERPLHVVPVEWKNGLQRLIQQRQLRFGYLYLESHEGSFCRHHVGHQAHIETGNAPEVTFKPSRKGDFSRDVFASKSLFVEQVEESSNGFAVVPGAHDIFKVLFVNEINAPDGIDLVANVVFQEGRRHLVAQTVGSSEGCQKQNALNDPECVLGIVLFSNLKCLFAHLEGKTVFSFRLVVKGSLGKLNTNHFSCLAF